MRRHTGLGMKMRRITGINVQEKKQAKRKRRVVHAKKNKKSSKMIGGGNIHEKGNLKRRNK